MLREIHLRLEQGIPSHPLVRAVFQSQTMTSVNDRNWLGEESSGVMVVAGDAEELDSFEGACREAASLPWIQDVRVLERTRRRVACYTRFRRPPPDRGASLEHAVNDHLGPGATLHYWASPSRIDVTVVAEALAPDCAVSGVQAALRNDFEVHLLYAGNPRIDGGSRLRLPTDAVSILRTALRMGYYESPRRASLDDLGRITGRCRSAIFERLRGLEERAVQELVNRADSRDEPSNPLGADPGWDRPSTPLGH